MGLSQPYRAKKDNVGMILVELKPQEVLYSHAVNFSWPVPGELIKCFKGHGNYQVTVFEYVGRVSTRQQGLALPPLSD
jgi:hypothetical protein